ncbi:MAG TPA: sigma-70 family RNA polymerase sigma factor [Mycobacteriales bacterium]|nr:sigma-70 family RNA polymerase sigma factor [Mycobacteriales bacterium]
MDAEKVTLAALAARDGDREAAALLVRATQADVWRLCAHLTDPASAEDLTQETYLRAFRALHRFAGRATARTWLLAIARRACADHVRALRRDRMRMARAVEPSPVGVPDISDGVALRALLAELDQDRREAFVLTQVIGLSYAETAAVCGCPVGTIRSRVARARDDLVTGMDADRSAEA